MPLLPNRLPLRSCVLLLGSCGLVLGPASVAADRANTAPELIPPASQAASDPLAGTAGLLHSTEQLNRLFRPFQTEYAALSPDGRYIAYSVREGEALSVIVAEIDRPEHAKTKVTVANDKASTPMLEEHSREHTPARIRWMAWVSPDRIAVETNQNFAYSADAAVSPIANRSASAPTSLFVPPSEPAVGTKWFNRAGAIVAFDADGKNGKTLVTPDDVAESYLDPDSGANRPGFDARTWSPDRPVGTVDSFQSTDEALTPEMNQSVWNPRSFSVVDFIPGEPDTLLLRTSGSRNIGLYKLHVRTGKLKLVSDESVGEYRAPLFDRQGKPRIVISNTTRASFPHRFLFETSGGLLRWKPLDQLAGFTGAAGFSVSPANFFGERAVPVSFDENSDVLYYASNIGRDTFGIYSLDMKTGKRGSLSIENPDFDLFEPGPDGFAAESVLVFDRFTRQLAGVRLQRWLRTARWIRPEWQAAQSAIEGVLPGCSVDILEWDAAGHRFLVLARGAGDPGAFYVFDRSTTRLTEFARRAPWLAEQAAHRTMVLSFKTPDGRTISGVLTLPRQPRMNPLPLMIVTAHEPWARVRADFRADVQALAELGLVVWQPNSRGAWGFGIKHREAIKNAYEETQIADMLAAVDHLVAHLPINSKRVSLLGDLRGGFLALRAVQLHPERFRCAVAINPTIDLEAWLSENRWGEHAVGPELIRDYLGDERRLKAAPLRRQADTIRKPVLVLSYPGRSGTPRTLSYLAAKNFAATVRKAGTTADFEDLEEDYMRGLPKARSAVFLQIEKFVNAHLYNYNVDVGETAERKE